MASSQCHKPVGQGQYVQAPEKTTITSHTGVSANIKTSTNGQHSSLTDKVKDILHSAGNILNHKKHDHTTRRSRRHRTGAGGTADHSSDSSSSSESEEEGHTRKKY